MNRLSVGEAAPNFDLSSTEDVLLMLRDEVVRTAVVLYVCADADTETSRADLLVLGRASDRLAAATARVLVVSGSKLDVLKELQRELHLPFPLLHDDRGFASRYGVAEDGEGAVLAVVDRDQTVRWISAPGDGVEAVFGQAAAAVEALPSPTAKLPRSIVNRLVDRWVN